MHWATHRHLLQPADEGIHSLPREEIVHDHLIRHGLTILLPKLEVPQVLLHGGGQLLLQDVQPVQRRHVDAMAREGMLPLELPLPNVVGIARVLGQRSRGLHG